QSLQHQRDVPYGTAMRPRAISSERQGKYAVPADQTLRSNNSHDVVVVRRISNRAGGIRSQCAHRQIRRHGGRGTAAGSTGNPRGVVRVAGLAAEAAPAYAGGSIVIQILLPQNNGS